MYNAKLIVVGAVACDVILGVPFYPQEDSKLRATSFRKRRGGNVGNSLEVLQQLIGPQRQGDRRAGHLALVLLAALPAKDSSGAAFIASSFAESDAPTAVVDMSHCLYRSEFSEPVTSYILSSEQNQSRTIVNHNPLPEMTFEEFKQVADSVLQPADAAQRERYWFHFEGRIPETTLQCMQYLRSHPELQDNLTISVEIEKPSRQGLQQLAFAADVVFYSRSWAEGEGCHSAEQCLRDQAVKVTSVTKGLIVPLEKWLICTWGASGACGLRLSPSNETLVSMNDLVHSAAFNVGDAQVVDSTGAGDTFIAGTLYELLRRNGLITGGSNEKSQAMLQEALDSANELAGRKILQHGFGGLGTSAKSAAARE